MTLPATADRADADALCTVVGWPLEAGIATRIPGPVAISVADARADEGPDAKLEFAVTLDRARGDTVQVDYATAGTASGSASRRGGNQEMRDMHRTELVRRVAGETGLAASPGARSGCGCRRGGRAVPEAGRRKRFLTSTVERDFG